VFFRNLFIHQQTLSDPIDLSVGTPEDSAHKKVKKAGIKAIKKNLTGYTPANGLSELRNKIVTKLSKDNNIILPANHITVVPGLTTGLLLVYMAILDLGDEIITIDPVIHLTNSLQRQWVLK
jgi:aspartate/methionine/tyrosine aminotransferase